MTLRSALTAALVACLGTIPIAAVWGQSKTNPACEPGFTIVEETCYKQVVTKVCRLVPDVKKVTKIVYSTKDEDFCLPSCPRPPFNHLCAPKCDDCPPVTANPGCGTPASRKLLVKREIVVDCPTYKRVVEEVVEQVPYKVYRKVPCDHFGRPVEVIPTPPVVQPQ